MSTFIETCRFCSIDAQRKQDSKGDKAHLNCPDCGEYEITGTAVATLEAIKSDEALCKIKGWIRDQNHNFSTARIDSDNIKHIASRKKPSFTERMDKLLIEVLVKDERINAEFNIEELRFCNATFTQDPDEFVALIDYLREQGFIEHPYMGPTYEITPKGFLRYEDLTRGKQSMSSSAFIAMWFDESMDDAHTDGLRKGIAGAGYDPIRIDQSEHVNKIDDEIIASINKSLFVVADFTGHRGGVYFEAGYAMGLGLPVFWTCKKTDMANLHFDIRQYNCIDWESSKELAIRLQNRIEAVIGPGPNSFE